MEFLEWWVVKVRFLGIVLIDWKTGRDDMACISESGLGLSL
jgi:hypothetical protein